MKYKIGTKLIDEDGNTGRVCIVWNDGDICSIEHDAAHPNPKIIDDDPRDFRYLTFKNSGTETKLIG